MTYTFNIILVFLVFKLSACGVLHSNETMTKLTIAYDDIIFNKNDIIVHYGV